MASSQPQRPFIPHRTPNKPQPAVRAADFRISKPFVPGDGRIAPELTTPEIVATPARVGSASMPGIDEFLQVQTGPPLTGVAGESFAADFDEEDELPPVEHFLDPLPSVADFSAEDLDRYARETVEAARGEAPQSANSDSGWLETDWQNYDWRAAAALGESGASEASTAWASTDWDIGAPRASGSRPTAAQAIASALDQIAERIRAGELAVPSPGEPSDPASIAAALAAMLGIRR